jgi:hypothetical protein
MEVDFEAIWVGHIAIISTQDRPRKRRKIPIVTLPITTTTATWPDAYSAFRYNWPSVDEWARSCG